MNTEAVRSVLLPEMIASEEKEVEERGQNCGSLNVWRNGLRKHENVWSAADKGVRQTKTSL